MQSLTDKERHEDARGDSLCDIKRLRERIEENIEELIEAKTQLEKITERVSILENIIKARKFLLEKMEFNHELEYDEQP